MNRTQQRFGIILPIILISYFMILLDNSIVFTSTVKIAADLNLSAQALSWVTNAYALTFGGLLMLGGRAGDIFGRRKIFLIGLVIFSIGSLLVGLSTSAGMIISMRALQGIGSAILAPTTLALLMDTYQDNMRTRAIVYYGATGGLGASFGLVIGGLISSYTTWRLGFLLNVPIGIVMLLLTLKFVPISQRSSAYVARFFFLGAMISYFFLTPQAMQNVYHFTPLMAALGFLPETVPQFIFATLVSRLNNRFTNNQILIAGQLITLVGLLMAALVGVRAGYVTAIAIPMVIIGIGQGFSLSPLTVAGVANTDAAIAGSASGVVNMVHQIGSSVGLSIITLMTAGIASPVVSYNTAVMIMTELMLISTLAAMNIARKSSND
ncbi:MFS transporter [Lactiplantibacillus pentosus]|uniref:MFS transporter n=1 Tax=Lactiplantibacillus pentosus TaxID=1589 RepID=UPI003C234634